MNTKNNQHKMKHITFILLLSFIFISCNKNKNIKKYYQNGSIKTEYLTIKNIIEGKYKKYYPSGALEYESNIKNGLRNGIEMAYYESGRVKMKGNCEQDKEVGFYYYYNKNGQKDSIIEYILINTDKPLQSYIDPQNYRDKEIIVNRKLIYDKNGKLNKFSSVYFYVEFFKDTILLGDTLKVAINFVIMTGMKQNNFKVFFHEDLSDKSIVQQSMKGQSILFHEKIPKSKGIGTIKGMIEENVGKGRYNYWFFNKNYYVE